MKTRKRIAATNRTVVIKFRCSASEKTVIRNKARNSGKNLSEYCRGQALHGKIYANRPLTPSEQEYFAALKDHNLGLARIGNYMKYRNPELCQAI